MIADRWYRMPIAASNLITLSFYDHIIIVSNIVDNVLQRHPWPIMVPYIDSQNTSRFDFTLLYLQPYFKFSIFSAHK